MKMLLKTIAWGAGAIATILLILMVFRYFNIWNPLHIRYYWNILYFANPLYFLAIFCFLAVHSHYCGNKDKAA